MIKNENYKKFLFIVMAIVTLGTLTTASHAVSLSTYRIYLDTENTSASFIMFNKQAYQESCSISLVHNNFDNLGNMHAATGDELPENSAAPWIRYSPKYFTVEPRAPQTVRFTLRRKANSKPAEYRSYLRVDCEEVVSEKQQLSKNKKANITIKPKLIQQIPIIARTGKLSASLSFGDIRAANDTLSFTIRRQGGRSAYGTLELVDIDSDEVITRKNNVSIYVETEKAQNSLAMKGYAPDKLALRFTEDENYGGNLIYKQAVIPK